jgi:hypothetical protein
MDTEEEKPKRDVTKFECQCMGVVDKGEMIHAVDCDDWNWHLEFTTKVARWVAAGRPTG